MFRNKRCLLLCLLMLLGSACAESPNLLSEALIQTETVNYAKSVAVELAAYTRDYSTSASEYYPYTYSVGPEVNNASFLEYHVTRNQEVKAGDVLATFTLDIDEAAVAAAKLSLERAQENYQLGKETKQEELAEMLKAQTALRDSFERELLTLRIQRAQIAYEQYCYQQECSIAQLTQDLAELEEAGANCCLYAPYDGIITGITYKREGEKVYKNEELITMYREEGMLLAISNAQLHFRYGMPVTVTSGAKNDQKTFRGRVVAADNFLPENRRKGYAFIELEPFENNQKPRLNRLNASATSEYVGNVMTIPRKAVTMDGGKFYVECVVNGSVQKRYVNVGLQNVANVWVVQGLQPGDTIMID